MRKWWKTSEASSCRNIRRVTKKDYELLEDQLRSVAYQVHPYRRPVIGLESDIKNWQLRDIKEYFDRYYVPNNAVAVVVGDVTLAQVKVLAAKHLEPLPVRRSTAPCTAGNRNKGVRNGSPFIKTSLPLLS